jgi:hypothetical protein
VVLTGATAAVLGIVCSTTLVALTEGIVTGMVAAWLGAIMSGVGVTAGLMAGVIMRIHLGGLPSAPAASLPGRLGSRDTAYAILFGGGWAVVWLLSQFVGGSMSDALAGHFEIVQIVQAVTGSAVAAGVCVAVAYAIAWSQHALASCTLAGAVAAAWLALPLMIEI